MADMRKLCATWMVRRPIITSMLSTETPYTRTLTLVLQESEWRALRDVEPDAVAWLQSQIRSRLAADDATRPTPRPPVYAFTEDEY